MLVKNTLTFGQPRRPLLMSQHQCFGTATSFQWYCIFWTWTENNYLLWRWQLLVLTILPNGNGPEWLLHCFQNKGIDDIPTVNYSTSNYMCIHTTW